jgi:hypothetical protein
MSNPYSPIVTDPMYRLWTDRPNKAWKLSGFYADKRGYHNTVHNNQHKWPGNYSIKLDLDLKHGNLDNSRAIDLTMSESEMIQWTHRMKAAAEDPNDTRLDAVREFYGTLDGKTVFGLIKDTVSGVWRRSSADKSHLWHGHMSIFTMFVNNWEMLAPILTVWSGQTFEEWKGEDDMFPKQGETSEEVRYYQFIHNMVRKEVTPPSPELIVDNTYGNATEAAFTDFAKKVGAAKYYKADKMTAWLATRYMGAMVKANETNYEPIISAAIEDWMTKNLSKYIKEIPTK